MSDIENNANPPIKFRLGRLPAKPIPDSVPRFRAVADLLPAPLVLNDKYLSVVNGPKYQMFMNDTLGCCAIAATGNSVLTFTTEDKDRIVMFKDSEIVSYYSHISGYVPGDPSTDNGCVLRDVLQDWMTNGIPNAENGTDKIAGYIYVDPTDINHVKQAIDNFGCAYIGINIPEYWDNNPYMAEWGVPPEGQGDSAGGHCVLPVGHNDDGIQVVSWGMIKTITYAAWPQFVEEAWAIVSSDFVGPDKISPLNTTVSEMVAALQGL